MEPPGYVQQPQRAYCALFVDYTKSGGTVKPGTLYVFLFYTESLPDDCNLHFLPYLNLWPRVGASGNVGANMYFLHFSDLIKCE